MPDASLSIKIGADVQDLVRNFQTAENTIGSLQAKLKELRAARLEIGDPAKLAVINQQITEVTTSLQRLKNIGKEGFDDLGIKIKLPTPEEIAVPFEIIDNRGKEAEAVVKALNAELTKLGAHKTTAPSFERFDFPQESASRNFNTPVFENLRKQAVEAGKSVQFVDTKLGDFAKGSVNEAKANVRLLEAEMAAFSAQERKSPIGRETAASLVLARKELVNVSKEAGITGETTSNAFGKAFGSIRQLAYILPGIGIAGIFSLAFEGVAEIIKEVTSALSDAEIENKSYSESLSGAGKKIGDVNEDVHRMAALFKDARDGVVSKTTVLNEYNKKFGDSLGIANDYNTAEALFNSKTAAYLEAMKQRAIADAAYGLAKKEIADQIEKNAKNELTFGASLKAGVAALFSATGAGNSFANSIKNSDDQSKKLVDSYNKVADAAEAAGQKISEAAGININGKTKTPKADKGPDTLEATKRALEEINKFTDDLGKVDSRPLFERLAQSIDPNREELLKTKIALAIRNNARDGISSAITDREVALLNQQLQKLLNPRLSSSLDSEVFKQRAEDISKAISEQFKHVDAKAYIHLVIAGFDQDVEKANAARIKKLKEEFGKNISSSIGSIASDEISNFGSLIGDALSGSGDDLDGAIKNIASILGQGLKTIGRLYIETAIAIALAKKTFSALAISNPIAAIAVGIGLEILGTVLENSVQKKSAHAFAEGGIVTQATMGLVGEAGPEAIIPLRKLDKIISQTQGAGTMRIDFNGRLQGNDIRLSQLRTVKQQRMV